jgi:hypothetical protein
VNHVQGHEDFTPIHLSLFTCHLSPSSFAALREIFLRLFFAFFVTFWEFWLPVNPDPQSIIWPNMHHAVGPEILRGMKWTTMYADDRGRLAKSKPALIFSRGISNWRSIPEVAGLNQRNRLSHMSHISGVPNYLDGCADLHPRKKFSCEVAGHSHTTMRGRIAG